MAWKSLPLAIFVTQRPFLFALPAGLLLMTHWREKFFVPPALRTLSSPRAVEPARPDSLFGSNCLLYAVLPAFHVFAFVFLSALLGWWWFLLASLQRWLLWPWQVDCAF